MTLQQEAASWRTPQYLHTDPAPVPGNIAPSTDKLTIPSADGRPTIITFLRHCGCPFAEKTFLSLRNTASLHPNIQCIAVSHSDQNHTAKWLDAIGGAGDIKVIVDHERELFARWGLGVSSFWHVLSPGALWAVYQLGRDEGIWNKPTESGTRWQTSGSFAVDGKGVVKWGRPAAYSGDIPDFEEAVRMLKGHGYGGEATAKL